MVHSSTESMAERQDYGSECNFRRLSARPELGLNVRVQSDDRSEPSGNQTATDDVLSVIGPGQGFPKYTTFSSRPRLSNRKRPRRYTSRMDLSLGQHEQTNVASVSTAVADIPAFTKL